MPARGNGAKGGLIVACPDLTRVQLRLVHYGRHGVGRLGTDGDEPSDRRIDAAIGGIAGLASGLLGVGGGFFMVPLQVIWARRDQHRAVGTSLAAILPIALVGAATYYIGRGTPPTDLAVVFLPAVGRLARAVRC